MGGCAYFIEVTPDHGRWVRSFLHEEKKRKASFLSRLFAKEQTSLPGLADLPFSGPGEALLNDYYFWIKKQIPLPLNGTAAFMDDYLFQIRAETYLRGERSDPSRPEKFTRWYIQIGFSGCAGQGEVGAQLASHWADIWYRENFTRIKDRLLIPHLINPPAQPPPPVDYGRFFEFRAWGMALYYPKGTEVERFVREKEMMVNFELDVGTEEGIQDQEELAAFFRDIKSVQANLPPELEQGACLCAMCLRSRKA